MLEVLIRQFTVNDKLLGMAHNSEVNSCYQEFTLKTPAEGT